MFVVGYYWEDELGQIRTEERKFSSYEKADEFRQQLLEQEIDIMHFYEEG